MNTKAEPLTVSTTEPLRPSRFESEVLVPVAQSLITAGITFVVLGVAAWRAGWPVDVPIFGTLAVLVSMWAWRLLRSDALMWRLERITKHDLTGDGTVGKPQSVALFNPPDARKKAKAAALPNNSVQQVRESLTAFVYLCASVERPTEKALGIPTGDREGYVQYRDRLMALGIAEWDDPANHARGWHLAVAPEVAAAIIEQHTV